MKPVHGDTVSNDGYSSTSCSNRSESGQIHQGSKNNLSSLFREKYIPLRESKLLEKLVKTRALYEELRTQLLSTSLSNSSSPDLNQCQQHSVNGKDVEEAEKSNIIALVDLVDKGVILRPKKLSECRDYNIHKSRLGYAQNEQIQQKLNAREYLTSKSSIISKHKPDEESRLGIQFKTKNIKSDPCTCTFKYGEIIKRKSKEVLKRVHPEETRKLNRKSNRKISHELKRSRPHFIEGTKLSVPKSIHSSDKVADNTKADKKSFFENMNRCHTIKFKPCNSLKDTNKILPSDSSQIKSDIRKKSIGVKANSSSKFNERLKKHPNHKTECINKKCSSRKYCEKYKHSIRSENTHTKRKAIDKKELNIQKASKNFTLDHNIPYSKKAVTLTRSIEIKKYNKSISLFTQEQNNIFFKILTALLPKISKRYIPLLATDITTKVDKAMVPDIKLKTPITPNHLLTHKNINSSISNLVGEKYRDHNKYLNTGQENDPRNFKITSNKNILPVNKSGISNLVWQHKYGQENSNFDKVLYESKPNSVSRNSATNDGHALKRCVNTSDPMNINNDLCQRTPNVIETECIKANIIQSRKKKCHIRKGKCQRNPLLPCEPFVCSHQECIPKEYESKLKIRTKQQVYSACKNTLGSNKISIHDSVKEPLLKKYLNKGASVKCMRKSKYTFPKRKVRRRLYPSMLGSKNIEDVIAKPIAISKAIVGSLDRIAVVPKTYCCHKNRFNKVNKVMSIKKYVGKSPRRCIKALNDNRNIKFTTSYLSQFIELAKSKKNLSSSVTYKSEVMIETCKQKGNYENVQTKHKPVTNRSKQMSNYDTKYNFKSGFIKDKKSAVCDSEFHNKSNMFHTNNVQSIISKLKHVRRNTHKSKTMQIKKERGWIIGPAAYNCYYALQLRQNNNLKNNTFKDTASNFTKENENSNRNNDERSKTLVNNPLKHTCSLQPHINRYYISKPQGFGIQKSLGKIKQNKTIKFDIAKQELQKNKDYKLMSKEIMKRAYINHFNESRDQRSEVTSKPNKYTSSLELLNNFETSNNKLFAPNQITKLQPKHGINRNSIFGTKITPQRSSKINHLSSTIAIKRQYTSKSSIKSISNIPFEFHESQLNFFSSADQSFNITSKETIEIKSKFSCEVNFSKHVLSKRSSIKDSQSKKIPLVLGRREFRHLENKGSVVYPSRIVRPIQLNHQLTGVSSLLRKCFCTMNIQVRGRGAPKKIPYKLKDYECEPGVCVPYECDPYECQKLIMQRLMRQVSKMSGTENKPRSSSTLTSSFKSNSKAKKLQSSSSHEYGRKNIRKRKAIRTKPQGLTYQTLPRNPQTQVQSHRQATRVGSSFSFDVEFSKNRSKASPVKEIISPPKPHSTSTHKSTDRHLKDKGYGTHKGNKRYKHSQANLKKMHHRTSVVAPMLKRCFCTLKLQKKGKQQKMRVIRTKSTSTPTNTIVDERQILRTREKGQNARAKHKAALLPYECEPGICIPGECDPYECLKLIKKRHVKEKGSGTKRHRTKSVSSSFASSKTSKEGVAQAMLQASPHEKVKRRHFTEPSESIIAREESSQESNRSRQAVRIGSTFSFDIEFYKERQFPSYQKVQAASEALRSTRRKMRHVANSQNTKKDIHPRLSHYSQMDGAAKADKAFGPMLRRCFCTLKLQKKQKRHKHPKPTKQPNIKVKPSRHRGTETPFSRPVPDLHDRSVMTAYKLKTNAYKLDPYECEPGVCVPGECDPYECLERIKRRHMDRGSSTDNVKTRSTFNMTKSGPRHRHNKNQFTAKERKKIKVRTAPPKGAKLEPRRESRTIVSSPSGSKQAVKIGSSFSFNVEFYKDRSHSGSTSSPKLQSKPKYEKPKHEKVKRPVNKTKSRASQGIFVSTRRRKIQRTKDVHDSESQVRDRKMRTKMTGVAPFLKRCFCTLQLQKRGEKPPKPRKKPPKPKKKRPDADNVSVGTETMKYKPKIHAIHKGTHTKRKYKYHGRTLDPNECEPGVCVPGECDPYECLERIKRRGMHSKYSNTGHVVRSHSVSSSAKDYRKSRPMRTQAHAPRDKKVKTKRTSDRSSVRERVTYDVSPSEQSHKQAVRIGSSFSFNVEFYKDRNRQDTTAHDFETHSETAKYTKKRLKRTRSGTGTKSRSVSSSHKQVRLRGRKMQSDLKTHSQGSGVGPLLKRCFCTLKLQKIGKKQKMQKIDKKQKMSSALLQTSPAPIETTYRNTGTKVRRRPEVKPIAAREKGTDARRGRHALKPYECEPGVCIPGECDPYECLERIKRRNMRHSGTGMPNARTKSMSSLPQGIKKTKSMNIHSPRQRRERRKGRPTESRHKLQQPPRPSRALENINVNNRQAVRLGSDFAFNIEFYKDRSKGVSNYKDRSKGISNYKDSSGESSDYKYRSRTSIPECSPSICKEPSCTPSKCKTSSCTSKCTYKNQGTHHSGLRHHHRKMQARGAIAESRGSGVRRLKRCFCTLTLQRAEVKTAMNSLRSATLRIKTQDRSTGTKQKYFDSLLPYECEPGVCVPGECDPYECLERIKRRRGPYGPCNCLEKRKAKIRRISRTTETNVKRSRDIPARQRISLDLSKKTQFTELPKINNVVEEPRFKMFNNPYTKNSVKISSNFGFNVEFTRDISFPSSTIDSDQNTIEPQNHQTDNTPKIKRAHETQKPASLKNDNTPKIKRAHETQKPASLKNDNTPKITRAHETQKPASLKNETTTTDLLKRCFCTKQLRQIDSMDRSSGLQFIRKCFCSKKSLEKKLDEAVPVKDKQHEPSFLRRCFCSKNLLKTRLNKELSEKIPSKETATPRKTASVKEAESKGSYKNPNKSIKCKCPPIKKMKCLCEKGRKTKCLCPSNAITVARVEIEYLKPKLQNIAQRDDKEIVISNADETLNKLSAAENLSKIICSHMLLQSKSNLLQSKKYRDSKTKSTTTAQVTGQLVLPSRKLLKCFGTHRLFNEKSKLNSSKLIPAISPVKTKSVILNHDKSLYANLSERHVCTANVLTKKSKQHKCNDISAAYVKGLKYKVSSPGMLRKLYSSSLIKTKSDQSGSKDVPPLSKSRDETKRTLSIIEVQKLLTKRTEHSGTKVNTAAPSDKRKPLSLFRPKEYWVQYQIQRPRLQKRRHNRNKCMNAADHKRNVISVVSSTTSLETILSYSPKKFNSSKSKTSLFCQTPLRKCHCHSGSNNTSCTVCRKLNIKQDGSTKKTHKDFNKNIIYTSERILVEKKTVSIENIHTRDRNPRSDLKKNICECLRLFRPKKIKPSNNKFTCTKFQNKDTDQHDKCTDMRNKSSIKWEQESENYYLALTKLNTLKNKQVQCSKNKNVCEKTIKNASCNIDMKDTNNSRSTIFHDKITNCKIKNAGCVTADLQNNVIYCKSQNTQCPTAAFHDKIVYCKSQNSQCPKAGLQDKITCKSQKSQCPKASFHDKVTYCKSQNSQCPTVSFHDKIKYCVPQTFQCPTGDTQEEKPYCTFQNSHLLQKKKKREFIKNILNCQYKHKNKTKLIKVIKVTSDFKHLICSNNAVYKIKDAVPPGASGDYKFAFVVESKGIQEDYDFFCSNNKNKEVPEKFLTDYKVPCACIFYKRKDKRPHKKSKLNKLSCPCLVCRKIVLPIKCSSDQKVSCHMMEVCKITNPKKRGKKKCCLQIKKTGDLDEGGHIIKKKPCKCGNEICAKETKKVAKEEHMTFKLNLFKKKKCICGSAPCAAKLNKDKDKVRRLGRKRLEKLLKKYKKLDAKHLKMCKKYNKIKNMEAIQDIKSNNSNGVLVFQSLLDLNHLAADTAKNIIRLGHRAIRDPKYTRERLKFMAHHPDELKKSSKKSCYHETCKRILMRLGAIRFVSKVREVFEAHAILNYLLHINDKRRRQRPIPLRKPDSCQLYTSSLRKKPCLWVNYLWPWFYPHCLNGLRMFKQFMDIILFMSAIVVWSPCLFGTELCRAMLCCVFCTA